MKSSYLLILALGLGAPTLASAQATTTRERSAAAPAPAQLDLATYLSMVRERSPAARALRTEVTVAEGEIDLAGVYPNPELSYVGMGRFDGNSSAINGTQHQVWLDVPILLAGQHDARRAVASADAARARVEVDVGLLGLEIGARRTFASWVASAARVSHMEAAKDALERLRGLLEARAAAGAETRLDAARVALEVARMEADLAAARADVERARTDIAATLGEATWRPTPVGTLDTLLDAPAALLDAPAAPRDAPAAPRADQTLPLVALARARLVTSERDVERAERERVPELRVGGGGYFTTDPDSMSAYLGLSMPLPLFDDGSANVRAARARREAAREVESAITIELDARLRGALSVLEARRAAVARFDDDAMSRMPELVSMAESSYRLGASRIFELLDTFRARLDLELGRVELVAALIDAENDVRAILGRPRR